MLFLYRWLFHSLPKPGIPVRTVNSHPDLRLWPGQGSCSAGCPHSGTTVPLRRLRSGDRAHLPTQPCASSTEGTSPWSLA